MQEMELCHQMEVDGGGFVSVASFCIIFGIAAYKMLRSKGGRISIPRLISIEWR